MTVSPQGIGVEGISDASTGDGRKCQRRCQDFSTVPAEPAVVCRVSTLAPKAPAFPARPISSTGVSGITNGSSGVGGYFDNTAAGNIIIGAVNGAHKFRVDGNGKVYFDGGEQTGGADFAESVSYRWKPQPARPRRSAGRGLDRQTPTGVVQPALFDFGRRHLFHQARVLATPHSLDETAANEIPLAIVGIVPLQSERGKWADRARRFAGEFFHSRPCHERHRPQPHAGRGGWQSIRAADQGKGVIQVLVTLQ